MWGGGEDERSRRARAKLSRRAADTSKAHSHLRIAAVAISYAAAARVTPAGIPVRRNAIGPPSVLVTSGSRYETTEKITQKYTHPIAVVTKSSVGEAALWSSRFPPVVVVVVLFGGGGGGRGGGGVCGPVNSTRGRGSSRRARRRTHGRRMHGCRSGQGPSAANGHRGRVTGRAHARYRSGVLVAIRDDE